MRMMEWIRKKGTTWLIGFLVFFLVSVFAGLGVSGGFNFGGGQRGPTRDAQFDFGPTLTSSDAVMLVNGRPVSQERFYTYVNQLKQRARLQLDDPSFLLDIIAYTSKQMILEEVISQKGESLGVEVTSADIAEAKQNAIALYLPDEGGTSGNILGDMTKGLSNARNRKAAFTEYLARQGVSEKEWKQRVTREIFITNTSEKIKETANTAALLKAEETKVLVDEALAEGELFQEVAREYSDDPSASKGGDVGAWIKPGLLSKEIEGVLYSLEKGGTSEWFEVGVGFQKFNVYARRDSTEADFEEAKPGIIEKLKKGKDEDYEPTEEEIAEDYLQIKYYFIQLNNSVPNAANTEINELVEQAQVEMNDPFILAHQALNGEILQPPVGWGFEELKKIALDSHVGEGYDFSLISKKLTKGNPDAFTDSEEENSSAEDEAEPGDDGEDKAEPGEDKAEPGDDGEDKAEPGDGLSAEPDNPAFAEPEDQPEDYPIYALGIGLLQLALEKQGENGTPQTNYIIAKVYLDWLDDIAQSDAQPLDRTEARETAENNLKRAADRYSYSPQVYAMRGLNLAWLDLVEEAKEQLSKAESYAPKQSGGVWNTIREAYEILDDEEALDSVDERISKWRQQELQAQIDKQQAAALQSQQPITINMDDFIKELPKDGDDESSGDGEAEDSTEAENSGDAEGIEE